MMNQLHSADQCSSNEMHKCCLIIIQDLFKTIVFILPYLFNLTPSTPTTNMARSKVLTKEKKKIILDVYRYFTEEKMFGVQIPLRKAFDRTGAALSISTESVRRVVKEEDRTGIIISTANEMQHLVQYIL